LVGVLVTNINRILEEGSATDHCPLAWDMVNLPESLVLMEVRTTTQVPPNLGDPDTPTPLELDAAEPIDNIQYPSGQYGSPEPRLLLEATIDARSYTLSAWFGPAAPIPDQDAADNVVRSLTFEERPSIRDSLPTCTFEIGDTISVDGAGAVVPGLGEGVAMIGDGPSSSSELFITTSPGGVVWVSPPGEYCVLSDYQ
jgi:hypothetical protein